MVEEVGDAVRDGVSSSGVRTHSCLEAALASSRSWMAEIAGRWSCSRTTVRRIPRRHGAHALALGGEVKNSLLRFDERDVKAVGARAQGWQGTGATS